MNESVRLTARDKYGEGFISSDTVGQVRRWCSETEWDLGVERDPLSECEVTGMERRQVVGVENGPLGIWDPREKQALVAESHTVVRVKENQLRGSPSQGREWRREVEGSGRETGTGSSGGCAERAGVTDDLVTSAVEAGNSMFHGSSNSSQSTSAVSLLRTL